MLMGIMRCGLETQRLVSSEGRKERMKQQYADYQVVSYPKIRRWMAAGKEIRLHAPSLSIRQKCVIPASTQGESRDRLHRD
jgi:hypothetical protein